MKRKSILSALVLVAVFAITGCSGQPLTTREKGTLGGLGIGAVAGTVIGAAVGDPAAGAAIGGALGGVGGYLVGNHMQNQEVAHDQTQNALESQQRELERQQREIQQVKREAETE